MADAPESFIQECITCGALIDTADEEPLALIHCPNCGAAARVRRMFDTLEIQELLGAGGMGAVYRALDTKLNRPVALKVLRREHMDNPDLIDSLTKEAEITASINHPHVVKVYTTGTAHGVFYIAMELVDKGSLDDLMVLQGKVGEMQVLEVGIQIAQGLDAALLRGLIHRDVKPGNILFASAHVAKITDFGLAILQANVGEGPGEIWGTPYYVAPEKLDTPPKEDFRSDLYSLGATLFHALAGRPPFEAETASMVALKHLKSQAVSLQAFAPEISSATAFVINKALSKDPEQRYDSYLDFAKSLQYAHDQVAEAARNPQEKRRVVVGDESEEAMSWVTFGMVAFIVIAGVLAFTFREQIFGKGESATPSPLTRNSGSSTEPVRSPVETELAAARQLLVEGKYPDAAAALRALDEKSGTPQPLQNWITLHGGLAYFLAGQTEEARTELRKIEQRGGYPDDPIEQEIAKFLVSAAELAAQPETQPAGIAAKFDKATYQSFALLLLAAKNWSLSAFDDAGALFRQFKSATPPTGYTWINELKPIADSFIADYTVYRAAADAVNAAESIEKKRTALEALRAAGPQIKQRATITKYFDHEEARLETELRLHDEQQARMKADAEAADTKALAEMKTSVKSYCAQYKFAEANGVVTGTAVSSDKGRAEKQLWESYTAGLAKFKAGLINDLNAKGYAGQIVRKNNTLLPTGKLQATEAQIEHVSQYAKIAAPWPDLAVNSVIHMAATFLASDAAAAADRKWQLGLYYIHAGGKAQGLKLLEHAAPSKPEYEELLPRFQEAFGAASP